MQLPRRVVIRKQDRVFSDFFKIDEVVVSHQLPDGSMSGDHRQLILERGDCVAVLLLNSDSNTAVMIERFKVAALMGRQRDDPATDDGWITAAITGSVGPNETPQASAIRAAMKETGYKIRDPRPIGKFFSCPGCTSERVFLFFDEVRDADRTGTADGVDHDGVKVVQMPLEQLFDRLSGGAIADPKLAIAALWLRDRLKFRPDREPFIGAIQAAVDAFFDRLAKTPMDGERLAKADGAFAEQRSQHAVKVSADAPKAQDAQAAAPLAFSTVQYLIKDKPELIVGYKTGAIDDIKDVSVWVNSENSDMMMDRFIGRSISAKIRFLGANRDEQGNVIEDTIEEALRSAVGQRAYVKIGTVLVTESGALKATHPVQRIFHVATVEGGPGTGVRADKMALKHCIAKILARAEEENTRLFRVLLRRKRFESILIPLLGAGDGGTPVEDVADAIIPAAVNHFHSASATTLNEIYFLAFRARDKRACDRVFERLRANGMLDRLKEA